MRGQLMAAAALGAAITLCAGRASAQGPPPPPLQGTVRSIAFTVPATGRTVHFTIYLPDNYSTSVQRYPVIYHLHGLGAAPGDPQNASVPQSFEFARALGIIGPVIIVLPNGYSNSWWADDVDGNKPAESDLVQQVIPYVDAHYRSLPSRGARVIEGFSMGGFGAIKFFAKFPGTFVCCVSYDGAMYTWQNMQAVHPGDAAAIFGSSSEYFDQYSPWLWSAANAPALGTGSPIRMVVATLVPQNQHFRDFLSGLQVPTGYIELGCDHNQGLMLSLQGLMSAMFIASRLDLTGSTCAPDADGNGWIQPADVGTFVGRWFTSLSQGTLVGDFNDDGDVSPADIGAFVNAWFVALVNGC